LDEPRLQLVGAPSAERREDLKTGPSRGTAVKGMNAADVDDDVVPDR